MRLISIFIAILVSYNPLQGWAEHTVLNGGGQGEQNITYSLMNFERFALLCEAISTCAVDTNDQLALEDAITHVSEVIDRTDFINFSTPKQDSRLVDASGNPLSFIMGNVWGSPVTINRDFLYRSGIGIGALPIPVSDALLIVSEILLRQRNRLSPDRIILLCGRLARLAGGALEEVVVGHGAVWVQSDRLLRFSAWKFPRATLDGYVSEVTIQDAEATHVITNDIASAVKCQKHFHHRPDQMLVRGLSIAQESANISTEVRAEVIFTCENDEQPGLITRSLGQLKIFSSFSAEAKSPHSYVLVSLKTQVE